MNWHEEKFRQPIAAGESLAKMDRRGLPDKGLSGRLKGIGLIMGQPRRQEKPTFHLRGGWSTLH